MFDFMIRLSQLALPIFIFATMANVGLTQDPKRIFVRGRHGSSGPLQSIGRRPDQRAAVNHGPSFAPVIHPTLQTGVEAMSASALAWLAK